METNFSVIIGVCNDIFRSGLISMYQKERPDLIIHEAEHMRALELQLSRTHAQLALIDMDLTGQCPPQTLQQVKLSYPLLRTIALYDASSKHEVINMLKNGGWSGFISKNTGRSDFLQALDNATHNNIYYCRETTAILSAYMCRNKNSRENPQEASFTYRERQIIRMICEEYTAKEIASRLSLSTRTVENRKIKILEKMKVKNIAGIVAYAYKYRLVNENMDNMQVH